MTLARRRDRRRALAVGPCPPAAAVCAAFAASVITVSGVHAQQPAWKPAVSAGAAHAQAKRAARQRTAKAAPAHRKKSGPTRSQSIVALVNDEPITGYEIEQRVKLAMLGAPELQRRMRSRLKSRKIDEEFRAYAIKRLKANPPKTQAEQKARIKQLQAQFVTSIRNKVLAAYRPTARKKALDELIEERLKLQEAKRLNVIASKDDVDRVVKGMAERNKMTPEEFTKHVAKMGASITTMRQRIKASLSWSDVIRRRFGHQIAVATREIGGIVTTAGGRDDVALKVQRILLGVRSDADQKRVAQRLSEAERVRASFSGCAGMSGLANGIGGARFDDLGERRPSSIPEPTRSLLLSAHDDEMLPPAIGEGGIELWAVCGRKAIKTAQAKSQNARSDLRQKEFEILSKKHLKDLRQDAHIEYRE